MAQRFEYYNTGNDSWCTLKNGYTWGQTFTPAIAHKITSVKIRIYKYGTPPTDIIAVRATSGGLPTGGDLCSGIIDSSGAPAFPNSAWVEISLGVGTILLPGVMYALYAYPGNGDTNNHTGWTMDETSPTYAGGHGFIGTTTIRTDWDFMFEEWGEPIAKPLAGNLTKALVQGAYI